MATSTRAPRKGSGPAGAPPNKARPAFIGDNAAQIVKDARGAFTALRNAELAVVDATTAIGAAFIAATRSGMVIRVGAGAPSRVTVRSFAELVLGDSGARMTVQRGRALAAIREVRPDLVDPTVGDAGRIPAAYFTSEHRISDKGMAVLSAIPANGRFADAVEAIRADAGKGRDQRPGGKNAKPDADGTDGDKGTAKSGPPADATAAAVADSVCALIRAFESRIGRPGWSLPEACDSLARIHDAAVTAQAAIDAAIEDAD